MFFHEKVMQMSRAPLMHVNISFRSRAFLRQDDRPKPFQTASIYVLLDMNYVLEKKSSNKKYFFRGEISFRKKVFFLKM